MPFLSCCFAPACESHQNQTNHPFHLPHQQQNSSLNQSTKHMRSESSAIHSSTQSCSLTVTMRIQKRRKKLYGRRVHTCQVKRQHAFFVFLLCSCMRKSSKSNKSSLPSPSSAAKLQPQPINQTHALRKHSHTQLHPVMQPHRHDAQPTAQQ